MRKIIMNLAMSLDGFIANEDGSYEWIKGYEDDSLNTKNQYNYETLLEDIDIVVMGKRCYEQDMHLEFKTKTVYVATHAPITAYDNIKFCGSDIIEVIQKEQQKAGKDIMLFGGGQLINTFLKADCIDEYIIGLIPIVLGAGRPLFYDNHPPIELKLEEYIVDNGIVILRYVNR
ncbi:dihydrofolate reductase family protein [Carnobacterium pleistocenium]|uniref:dihydrofolate reductase family protein n=1 Tax=Carnobacterium pleistocenium TaxID=181073 RepID=UPI00054FB7F9|nr:dihydrofolate reductase family protein [Carnobacterium pleistocenium]